MYTLFWLVVNHIPVYAYGYNYNTVGVYFSNECCSRYCSIGSRISNIPLDWFANQDRLNRLITVSG